MLANRCGYLKQNVIMEKQFIPYEQALKIKELGFDEKCLAHYLVGHRIKDKVSLEIGDFRYSNDTFCKAPLWQQAFDWFREKHKLMIFINYHIMGTFRIEALPNSKINLVSYKEKYFDNDGKMWKSFKQTQLALLNKLLEIVSSETD